MSELLICYLSLVDEQISSKIISKTPEVIKQENIRTDRDLQMRSKALQKLITDGLERREKVVMEGKIVLFHLYLDHNTSEIPRSNIYKVIYPKPKSKVKSSIYR